MGIIPIFFASCSSVNFWMKTGILQTTGKWRWECIELCKARSGSKLDGYFMEFDMEPFHVRLFSEESPDIYDSKKLPNEPTFQRLVYKLLGPNASEQSFLPFRLLVWMEHGSGDQKPPHCPSPLKRFTIGCRRWQRATINGDAVEEIISESLRFRSSLKGAEWHQRKRTEKKP